MASIDLFYEKRIDSLEEDKKQLQEENEQLLEIIKQLRIDLSEKSNPIVLDTHPSKYTGAAEEVESSPTEDDVQTPKETQLKITIIRGSVFQNDWNDNIEEASMCDAGGWHHFKNNTPTKAGGAAGALYRKMRIRFFCSEAQKIELGSALVGYYQIGKKKNKKTLAIIHTAGINFNLVPDWTQEQAQESLNRIYTEIFCAHISTNRKKLFFPPISGGRFAGRFREMMPQMQALAIQKGFEKLSTDHQTQLRESDIYLCLYNKSDLEDYYPRESLI